MKVEWEVSEGDVCVCAEQTRGKTREWLGSKTLSGLSGEREDQRLARAAQVHTESIVLGEPQVR
jgi:hypothetical protein